MKHRNLLSLLLVTFSSLSVITQTNSFTQNHPLIADHNAGSATPFTAKAALIRHWNRKIPTNRPKPDFFLSKASPLTSLQSAVFEKLADSNTLPSHLPQFCSSANLACFPDLQNDLAHHNKDANFGSYSNVNFTNYGSGKVVGGVDSFTKYSPDDNLPIDTFRRYSRDSNNHNDSFANYESDGNVVTSNFTSYGSGALDGAGEFTSYGEGSNVPDHKFSNYETQAADRERTFKSYADNTNAGDQSFKGYGRKGHAVGETFTSYGNNSNVVGSGFDGYGEDSGFAKDSFTSYGSNQNVPENTFNSYASGGESGSDTFANYRDNANVGDDTFTSYAKKATGAIEEFSNYGQSANVGSDTFSGYGKGAQFQTVGFKIYGSNTTFKDYEKKDQISFQTYTKAASANSETDAKRIKIEHLVEAGKFFREAELKKGTVMPMPDIRDKMPRRSFLPRSLAEKLPFSGARISDLEEIFKAVRESSLDRSMKQTIQECERKPSRGETKRCATSAESMIDFAVSVLGNDVVVRSTESTAGSGGNIMIGDVHGINGGRVTKSVSCHQSLFPYLVYYCHSVPKVRVYEAEILSVENKRKINHGVAICHLDTSDWSAGHGAFLALGSGPGKIEVCHWIFEGDMTWAVAD
ncbi:Polygalacturonase-1 non-catalytic subunit beta [Acorus gramineus]|uniref:Polygalacturonase-1 non-catalytic subunit beta n=1 Tax=Acorus gramineus TaxID=55184 RepID=A0AAV9BV86_ACOGR|nr:Polygalacturonase-1 non-catalytic subunit beta [Acorus gramineus]